MLKSFVRWKKLLATERDAIIHYNYPLDAPSIIRDSFFIRYAFKHRRKIVIHIHGGLYLFKDDKPWIIDRILKSVFGYNVPVIVLSDKEKEHICKVYNRKNVYSLPNCIELKDAKSFVRMENETRLRLLYLGRIEKNKGMDYILEALKMLKAQGEDFLLKMAGKETVEGEYINRFKKALGNKFEYCGVVSGSRKYDLLKESDVFVMPSYYEGLPMALLECMSYGVVPVVTNVGSIGEYVSDGENGIIVNVKDSESIFKGILMLDKKRDCLYNLSQNARNTIFTRLKPEGYVAKLNEIYRY